MNNALQKPRTMLLHLVLVVFLAFQIRSEPAHAGSSSDDVPMIVCFSLLAMISAGAIGYNVYHYQPLPDSSDSEATISLQKNQDQLDFENFGGLTDFELLGRQPSDYFLDLIS